jgi:hypothetical protein
VNLKVAQMIAVEMEDVLMDYASAKSDFSEAIVLLKNVLEIVVIMEFAIMKLENVFAMMDFLDKIVVRNPAKIIAQIMDLVLMEDVFVK